MLPNTCSAAHTFSFCSGHTHPPQQFPVCCLHPTNLLLSQHPKNLNNCQSHEQAVIISRLYSTTTWCLQLQLNVMQKEEKAGTSSHFLQLWHILGGLPSKLGQRAWTEHSSASDQSWELHSSNPIAQTVLCKAQHSPLYLLTYLLAHES